jgi:hypothetical protein
MKQLPFIYSNQPRWRVLRHCSFWLLWFVFQLFLYTFSPSPVLQKQPFWNRVMITWPDTVMYMLPSFFLAYTLMYLVIPGMILPGKYFVAAISTIVLIVLTGAMSAMLSVTIIDRIRQFYAASISPTIAGEPHPPLYVQLGVAMLAGLRGNITVGGVAAAIKLMKCFYEKQQAALLLEKEKAAAELQMLKAQLHPHFLFNTLNNIYSFTQPVSEKASGMILGLSQLLRYMLYECNKPLVPLDKELKMVGDYLNLEKARYEADLDLALQIPKQPTDLLIAPLLLLPFIENAFKHGASQMTEQAWISLTLTISDENLLMKLVNGKPACAANRVPGIGIKNVQKRLELLYPATHSLLIVEEDEMYVVNLELKLIAPVRAEINNLSHEFAQTI